MPSRHDEKGGDGMSISASSVSSLHQEGRGGAGSRGPVLPAPGRVSDSRAASRKAGSLPDAGQGIGDECVGLFGRWSLIAPALEDLGHGSMAGGVIALRYALGGMGVGDRGSACSMVAIAFPSAARWPR